jgi:hypothetical protein
MTAAFIGGLHALQDQSAHADIEGLPVGCPGSARSGTNPYFTGISWRPFSCLTQRIGSQPEKDAGEYEVSSRRQVACTAGRGQQAGRSHGEQWPPMAIGYLWNH